MASKKATITGRGPELFGRGIDLLFGESNGDNQAQHDERQPIARSTGNGAAREAAYLDAHGATSEASPAIDEYLRWAAEVFFQAQANLLTPDASFHPDLVPEQPATIDDDSGLSAGPTDFVADQPVSSLPTIVELSTQPPPLSDSQFAASVNEQSTAAIPMTAEPTPAPETVVLAQDQQENIEGDIMPETIQINQVDEIKPEQPPAATPGRKVGAPSANGSGDGAESMLSDDISKTPGTSLTKQEAREILSKLRRGDLNALDKEIDRLYEKVSQLLSSNRKEATIAFDILRKARLMLLKDPEQYADAEYLVRQVGARINQIEQSLEGGRTYAPRLFAYQVIWVAVLGLLALVTTLGGTTFSAWVSYLLGIPLDSERLNWTVLFISTLAWGGIGGVTSALWSLFHHISVQRDYDPVENLWYYSQPVLGMVLGGIVFLIMGSGFLVVQVNLTAQDAALGARLLPAAIAVVAGFRQAMVLDLIERIIALIMPGKPEEQPELQLQSVATPSSEEPAI